MSKGPYPCQIGRDTSIAPLRIGVYDYGMKHTLIALGCAVVALTACTPTQQATWVKPGVSQTSAERGALVCEARARRAFPVNMQPDTLDQPSTTIGGRACNGPVCVNLSKGIGQSTYYYDANKSLRRRALESCLTEGGYRRMLLPVCPKGSVVNRLQSHPTSVEGVCVSEGVLYQPL